MATILTDNRIISSVDARVESADLWMPAGELERIAGEAPRADGLPQACLRDGKVNVSACWRHLGRPVLSDSTADVWVLGASAAERGAALQSLRAPDFTLSDLDGRPHALSDYRGKKVFLASWASW